MDVAVADGLAMILEADVAGGVAIAKRQRLVGVAEHASIIEFLIALDVLTIEPDIQCVAYEPDAIGVPLARRLDGVGGGGDGVVDGTAGVERGVVAIVVIDLDLEARECGITKSRAPQAEARVCSFRHVEIEKQFEVTVGLIRTQPPAATGLLDDQLVTLNSPGVDVARGCPSFQGFPVEQLDPALAGLLSPGKSGERRD